MPEITRPFLDYLGGKFNQRQWIVSHFPDHQIYCEPFGGAGSVLFYKKRTRVEVYNDICDEVVNVFNMARDNGAELERALNLTPYSRTEYNNARIPSDEPIENARRTIIKSFMGIGGSIQQLSGFRCSKQSNSNSARTFYNYVDSIEQFTKRLKNVYIENMDAIDLIRKYDTEETLFYIDPPYVHSTRSGGHRYNFEMTNEQHAELIRLLLHIKGNVIISGYENDVYDVIPWKQFQMECETQSGKRNETIWVKNPKNDDQLNLFSQRS